MDEKEFICSVGCLDVECDDCIHYARCSSCVNDGNCDHQLHGDVCDNP